MATDNANFIPTVTDVDNSMMNSSAKSVIEAYELGLPGYTEAWQVPHPWLEQDRVALLHLIQPSSRIVDVGCGPGHDVAFWHSHGHHVLGIDISPSVIDYARKRYPHCNFQCVDMRDTHSLDPIDCVLLSYSLLHIPCQEVYSVFSGIVEQVRAGGLVFLALSIGDTTIEKDVPVAGLADKNDAPVPVLMVKWDKEEFLQTVISPASLNIIHDRECTPFGDDRKSWSVILRKR